MIADLLSYRTGPLRVATHKRRPVCGDPGSRGHFVACVLFLGRDYLFHQRELVAGDGGVDGAGPGVDAASEGLDVLEALVAQPHSYVEGARAVMAEDDDGSVGVELGVGARGDFAHGHEKRIGKVGGLVLPGFAYI